MKSSSVHDISQFHHIEEVKESGHMQIIYPQLPSDGEEIELQVTQLLSVDVKSQGSVSDKMALFKEGLKSFFRGFQQPPAEVQFDVKSFPVYLLGMPYNHIYQPSGSKAYVKQEKKNFLQNFKSIPWMTYRKNFKPLLEGRVLPPAMSGRKLRHKTTDAGWGCMIRAGQMLVATSLLRHVFDGRIVTLTSIKGKPEYESKYQSVLSQFVDNETKAAFSIQNVAIMGLRCERAPGDWYGPSTISYVVRKLNKLQRPFPNFEIIICQDGIMYIDEVVRQARRIKKKDTEQQKEQKAFHASLILVPARLGLQTFDADYLDSIRQFFKLPECVGIIGGKPNFALYFVGIQKNSLIYLDPHYVQNATSFETLPLKMKTYHCPVAKIINIKKVDTSLAFGFYVRNESEFSDLVKKLIKIEKDFKGLMTIMEKKPESYEHCSEIVNDEAIAVDEDEFVLI